MQSLGRALPRADGPRRDPAPSRWQYRMQRLWLTPLFRVLFRVGLPLLVVGGISAAVLLNDGRRAAIVQGFADLRILPDLDGRDRVVAAMQPGDAGRCGAA